VEVAAGARVESREEPFGGLFPVERRPVELNGEAELFPGKDDIFTKRRFFLKSALEFDLKTRLLKKLRYGGF
jgi:hypothetical protein